MCVLNSVIVNLDCQFDEGYKQRRDTSRYGNFQKELSEWGSGSLLLCCHPHCFKHSPLTSYYSFFFWILVFSYVHLCVVVTRCVYLTVSGYRGWQRERDLLELKLQLVRTTKGDCSEPNLTPLQEELNHLPRLRVQLPWPSNVSWRPETLQRSSRSFSSSRMGLLETSSPKDWDSYWILVPSCTQVVISDYPASIMSVSLVKSLLEYVPILSVLFFWITQTSTRDDSRETEL